MYQALRSLGIDTQLVIYPNEFHGITRPSYVKDRYQRYLDWYDKYVKGNKQPVRNVAEGGTPESYAGHIRQDNVATGSGRHGSQLF